MAVTAAAKTNHDQLFGDCVSTLAQTDPELIDYFDNFAFDEVYADATRLGDTLDLHTCLMVQLAAILARGGLAEFRVMAAAAPGVTLNADDNSYGAAELAPAARRR
jgi:4-carboxymuconolactone decarboxylase